MSKHLVSIIVPAYNASEYIIDNLESVKKQTYSEWECIIVNDGSTDDTIEKVQPFIEGDSRFTLINQKNSGVCVARNLAVAHSKGYFLFPLDSDNYIHPDCLARCAAEFEKNANVRLVYTETQLFGARNDLWNLPPFNYVTMLKYNMVDNSSLFLRKDFDKVGGYRTNMVNGLEDWDFFIALLYGCSDEQVIKIPEPLFFYRSSYSGRGATVASNSKQKEMLDNIVFNNFFIYEKYYPEIFKRIHEYDYLKMMIDKAPVKWMVRLMSKLSKTKSALLNKPIS